MPCCMSVTARSPKVPAMFQTELAKHMTRALVTMELEVATATGSAQQTRAELTMSLNAQASTEQAVADAAG